MSVEHLNGEPAEKSCHSIEDVAELYGVNPWTIRLWIDRFGIPGHFVDANGGIWFSPRAAEQIGTICRLMKKKLKLEDVRKHLECVFDECREQKENHSVI